MNTSSNTFPFFLFSYADHLNLGHPPGADSDVFMIIEWYQYEHFGLTVSTLAPSQSNRLAQVEWKPHTSFKFLQDDIDML